MNGYDLAEKMRKTRRRHNLSAATQALYYELVAICNEEGWVDEFKCSNDELTAALKISEKSLIQYRLELIQSGLLFYLSGKSKKKVGTYSFKKEFLNGCKFYNQSDSLMGSQSGSQSDSQSGKNPSDLIKTKTEILVFIEKRDFDYEKINGLFSADEGLKMAYTQKGLPPGEFSNAVLEWMNQNSGAEYHDFTKARKHFLFWIPNFKRETNGKATAGAYGKRPARKEFSGEGGY